jgi:hypothetical protein
MFSLSDEEMDRLTAAASMLPVSSRSAFLKSVAGRVAGIPNAGMAEIESAIQFVLNNYGVAGGVDAFTRKKQHAKGKLNEQIFR